MKKRLFALMLVVAMVLGMNTVAFAEGTTEPAAKTVKGTFTKTYSSESEVYPAETLGFTAEPVEDYTNAPTITVDSLVVDTTFTGKSVVKDVEYTVSYNDSMDLGYYYYKITETGKSGFAGVTYGNEEVGIVVLVANDETTTDVKTDKVATTDSALIGEQAAKVENITNVYNVGSITVDKEVQGALAKQDDTFTVNLKFTSAVPVGAAINVAGTDVNTWTGDAENGYVCETSFTISAADGTKTIGNIPYGVTVEVKEAKDENNKTANGYTYISGDETITINESVASDSVTFVNELDGDIETGIIVNNMPYIIALVVLAAAAVVFFRRRREF